MRPHLHLEDTGPAAGGPDDLFPPDRGIHMLARFVHYATDALPGGSGRLILERMRLPPGSALTAFEASSLWRGLASGKRR